MMVSVPYRGATFLNCDTENGTPTQWSKFPSPIGELHFSMEDQKPSKYSLSFRPLSGSYISQCRRDGMKIKQIKCRVSVPYRGATFLNHFMEDVEKKLNRISFRPLSGSYISQYYLKVVKILIRQVSVPYRGATFLNNINRSERDGG